MRAPCGHLAGLQIMLTCSFSYRSALQDFRVPVTATVYFDVIGSLLVSIQDHDHHRDTGVCRRARMVSNHPSKTGADPGDCMKRNREGCGSPPCASSAIVHKSRRIQRMQARDCACPHRTTKKSIPACGNLLSDRSMLPTSKQTEA